MNKETNNPLGVQPVNRLLSQFAIPSIISMLVGSLYNIVTSFLLDREWANWEMRLLTLHFRYPLRV